jgi:riboflavin kinase/FMN adenylyltransferase
VQFFDGLGAVPQGFGPSVVTIGKFNGVHIGHLEMIRLTRELASAAGAASVVMTFDRHPAALLNPERVPDDITGPQSRIELIEAAGPDALLLLPFDEALAALSPREFVESILVEALSAQSVVVGRDFRFGHAAEGTVDTLRELGLELGFAVEVIADVRTPTGERVSSSLVRNLLNEGDIAQANALLGRHHSMRGEVVHGDARGRLLGFPTANLSHEASGFLPADGTYAGWLVDADGTRYPVAMSIGTNPSFPGERHRRLEAFVLDHTLDLYGHIVVIEFVARLRGMYKFDDIDALIAQMNDDVVNTREVLGLPQS